MPTFNQLVRKGRQVLATKSTAPAPVSYTHLDVYKRQEDNNSGAEAPASSDEVDF